jgi:hypothetical protein
LADRAQLLLEVRTSDALAAMAALAHSSDRPRVDRPALSLLASPAGTTGITAANRALTLQLLEKKSAAGGSASAMGIATGATGEWHRQSLAPGPAGKIAALLPSGRHLP